MSRFTSWIAKLIKHPSAQPHNSPGSIASQLAEEYMKAEAQPKEPQSEVPHQPRLRRISERVLYNTKPGWEGITKGYGAEERARYFLSNLQYYGKSPHNIDILSIDFTASDGSLLFNHFPEDGENVAQIKIRFTNSFFANEYYKSLGSLINLNELQPPQQTPGASTYEIYIPIDKFEKMVNSKNYGYDAFEKSENTQKKEKPTETKLLQQHPAATPGTPHANRESQEHNKTTEDKMPKPSQEETRMPIAKSS